MLPWVTEATAELGWLSWHHLFQRLPNRGNTRCQLLTEVVQLRVSEILARAPPWTLNIRALISRVFPPQVTQVHANYAIPTSVSHHNHNSSREALRVKSGNQPSQFAVRQCKCSPVPTL